MAYPEKGERAERAERVDRVERGERADAVGGPVAAALHSGPFDLALRTAIAARGLTLERLRTRLIDSGLHVGVTTLSYWQRGIRRPERPESLRAVTALEGILGLPQHSLTVLLGPPKPRGFAIRNGQWPNPFADIVRVPGDLGRQLAEMDSPAAGKLDIVSEHNVVTIGARRELVAVDVIWVLRAHYDGVDRALMVYNGDPGTDADAIEVVVQDGCRVGRVRRDSETRSIVSELLFDRSLRAGDTQVLTYRIHPNSGIECREHFNGYRFSGGLFVLYVRFHPDTLPVRCQSFAARHTEGPTEESAELTVDSHRSIHLVVPDIRPGVVGVRWEWE
ncbi:hypothetical protein GCM10009839_42010 [Catenulispora yoronensis]|uniref:XRE family transcriptional regulator n=1 Tax=Catenulispora yoronensis TaxID=450799 RepID=A0ABP5FYI4_9ACTN